MGLEKSIIIQGTPVEDESRSCSEILTPGEHVEINTGKYRKHASAGKNSSRAFVLPRESMGEGIDDTYPADSRVRVGYFPPGSVVHTWMPSGEGAVEGETYYESDGAGGVRALITDAATDDTQRASVLGVADETIPTAVVRTRVKVRIV